MVSGSTIGGSNAGDSNGRSKPVRPYASTVDNCNGCWTDCLLNRSKRIDR